MVSLISFSLPSLLSASLSVLLLGCSLSPSSSTGSVPAVQTPPAAAQPAPSPISQQPAPAVTNPAANQPTGQVLPITAQAIMGGQTIQLEVARTFRQQAMGLMHRPALPDDRGMLFPFDPPRPVQFWMKNTPQPLDMVFMLNGEIQAIAPNSPPCTTDPCPTYGTDKPVNQVIELRAGRAAELGLSVGDRVEIRFLDQPIQ